MRDEPLGVAMLVRILGEIGADRDGRSVEIAGPQVRRLFAVLVISAGRTVSTERLMDVLFPEGLADRSRTATVRTYVSRLRGTIGDDLIETTAIGYRLAIGRDAVDAERFARLVARAATGDPSERLATLDDALALWPSGRALSEFADDEWCRGEAVRLDELRLLAVEQRLDIRLGLGSHGAVCVEAESLARDYPYRERFWSLWMLALYRCGRQVEALRVAHEYRETLADGTGLIPGGEFVDMERRIIAKDQTLDLLTATVPPTQLRGYVLHERVGGGAFGSVFRAVQPSVDRDVAIKVIRREYADDPHFVRRFESEAQLVASLEHPHIVPVYDYWREPGGAYIVMRFLRGGSAKGRLRRGPLDLGLVTRVVTSIGSALTMAHTHGVAHGDVKAANILFDERDDAYLADFGIAAGHAELAGLRRRVPPIGHLHDQTTFARLIGQLLTGQETDSDRSAETTTTELTSGRADLPAACGEVLARAVESGDADQYTDIAAFVAAWTVAVGQAQPLTMDPPAARPEPVNPYKGLRSFGEADTPDFFGRDELIDELDRRCRDRRFVAVVGASGSGKSSAVRSGLVPRLRATELFVITMVPGAHPFDELERALLRVAVDPPAGWNVGLSSDGGIDQAVRRVVPDSSTGIVLIVDQFEEIWTLVSTEEQSRFFGALAATANDSDSLVRVVVVLRADFYDRPLQHPLLGPLTRAGTVAVTALSPGQLEAAITGPVARFGVRCEPALVADLISHSITQPGSLPLLQFALTDLFDRRVEQLMTVDAYVAMGGIAGALAGRAEELCQRHHPDTVRRLFIRLVTLGDGAPDTRRRVRRSELEGIPGAVIDDFGKSRLLTFDHDAVTREATVELAHEALLVSWPRLADWLATDRDDLRGQRHLTDAAAAWQARGRDASDLYHGGRLHAAQLFAVAHPDALNPTERAFLAAGAARAKRGRRLTRAAVLALVVLSVVAASAAVVARSQRSLAERAALNAKINADRADAEAGKSDVNAATAHANALRADAAAALQTETATNAQIRNLAREGRDLAADQPTLGLLLAAEAYRRLPGDADTQGGLQAALVANPIFVVWFGFRAHSVGAGTPD